MKTVLFCFLAIVITVLNSCKKDDEEICIQSISDEEDWVKFIGDYKVYDTTDVFLYDMSISHHYSGDNIYGNESDSLLVENMAGMFDYSYEFDLSTDESYIDLNHQDPLVDHDGFSWYFWSNSDDLETEVVENRLVNDTIVLYFLIDNTPYWVSEGTFYHSFDGKHVAVKQN